MKPCSHIKKDGNRCSALALPGREKCCFHDEALAEKRAEGRRTGGRNRRKKPLPESILLPGPAPSPPLPLATPSDICAALCRVFNEVRSGSLGASVGNCLGLLAGQLLKAIDQADITQRIEAIEDALPQFRRRA